MTQLEILLCLSDMWADQPEEYFETRWPIISEAARQLQDHWAKQRTPGTWEEAVSFVLSTEVDTSFNP